MMAKWARARVIAVDIAADKFDACRKAGADEVVDPRDGDVVAALRELTHGEGVDVAIDYVCATSTLEAGVKALGPSRPAGHPRRRLAAVSGAGARHAPKEQTILGSRYVTRREILEVFDLVKRGEVSRWSRN